MDNVIYKIDEKEKDKLSLFSFEQGSSLEYIGEEIKKSLSNQIQSICDIYFSENFEQMHIQLARFSDLFYGVKDEYIPETITDLIEILFNFINSYLLNDSLINLIPDDDKFNVFIKCLTILVNISFHTDIISAFPQCIFDLFCLQFAEHRMSQKLPDINNIFICFPDCLKILVNLTSDNDSCQEIKQRLALDDIQDFYFNQDYIQTFYSNRDCIIKIKTNALKIFFNIINNSDIESSNFPSDQMIDFMRRIIDTSQILYYTKWIINIVFLLIQNKMIATIVMEDPTFISFVNFCLEEKNFVEMSYKPTEITEIQIKALQIISMLLNIEEYNFEFDVQKVVYLADTQNNLKLILTALQTIQNYVDCPEHSDIVIDCNVIPVINSRIKFGTNKMKKMASKILANLFFYTPVINLNDISNETEDGDLEYELLADVLFDFDDDCAIYVCLKGFYNFFNRLIELDWDIINIVDSTSLLERLPQLEEQIKDEKTISALESLISLIHSQYEEE